MAGVFDFLHLKRNTKGSSNELSFDVLDAARNDLDSKKRKGSRFVIPTPQTVRPVATKAPDTNATATAPEPPKAPKPSKEAKPAKPARGEKAARKHKQREAEREEKRKKKERKKLNSTKLLDTSTDQSVKPSRGTSHGVKKNASLSTVPEVERRKKSRHARRVRMGVIAAVFVVVAIGVGAFLGYQYYQGRVTFENRYAEMVSCISDVDKDLVELEAILAKSPADVTDEDVTTIEKLVPQVKDGLQRVTPQIDVLAKDATREKDMLALEYAASAVDGRLDMVGFSERLSGLYAKANKASAEANEAWGLVSSADQLARESVAEANAASTEEALNASKEKTQQAIERIEEARKQLEDVAAIYDGAIFSSQISYLDKRKEALEHEVLVNEALLAGDRQRAIDENDAYNAADEEAVRIASTLPASPSAQARSSYDAKILATKDSYKGTREEVTRADANIRSYLASGSI